MTTTAISPAGAIGTPSAGTATAPRARRAEYVSWALTGVVSVFLIAVGAAKLARPKPVLDSFAELGWPSDLTVTVGLLLLGCVALHLIPRTSILGAGLLTAYLGGAVGANLRIEAPLLTHVLFPVYVAAVVWLALYLRDPRVRALVAAR